VLDGQVSLAFITYGRRIFADEERVSCEGVSDSGSCNDNFLSSVELMKGRPYICIVLLLPSRVLIVFSFEKHISQLATGIVAKLASENVILL